MENKKIKVYVVGGSIGYANWLPNHELVNNLEDSDLVLFTGGEDVSPHLYGQSKHPTTYCNLNRDIYETKLFKQAIELNKHVLGVCRGSQFSCVMAGGILVQNQGQSGMYHDINTSSGETIRVTSTHHQAQFPFVLNDDEYKVLGWTTNESKYHQGGSNEELNPPKECEIVYYPKIKCLGIQSHPEMVFPPSELWEKTMIDYMQELIIKLLKNEL